MKCILKSANGPVPLYTLVSVFFNKSQAEVVKNIHLAVVFFSLVSCLPKPFWWNRKGRKVPKGDQNARLE